MLTRAHHPPDETLTLLPISVVTTPYTFTPRPLPSLCSRVPSRHASDTADHSYTRGVPSRHAPDTAYHPYTRGVHSQHAPDSTYPYACVVPSQHAPDTADYHHTHGVPSQHCLPSLQSRSALPICSQHHLSLHLCSALPTCPRHHLLLRLCIALPTLLTLLTLAECLSQGLLDRNTRVAWHSAIRELTWKTPKE
ncbi:hypothetical protein O181_051857 [Austropuccinia psidii MF-1]|uniref:Uncharacterized protein n=1 Tax=Austropuccinia psidii MF-1 TaxID=1389203 RepID=A0A9Q3HPY6_9BASI|nr:hypothetical protein [Austropuccinia psidii MF-1]